MPEVNATTRTSFSTNLHGDPPAEYLWILMAKDPGDPCSMRMGDPGSGLSEGEGSGLGVADGLDLRVADALGEGLLALSIETLPVASCTVPSNSKVASTFGVGELCLGEGPGDAGPGGSQAVASKMRRSVLKMSLWMRNLSSCPLVTAILYETNPKRSN